MGKVRLHSRRRPEALSLRLRSRERHASTIVARNAAAGSLGRGGDLGRQSPLIVHSGPSVKHLRRSELPISPQLSASDQFAGQPTQQ